MEDPNLSASFLQLVLSNTVAWPPSPKDSLETCVFCEVEVEEEDRTHSRHLVGTRQIHNMVEKETVKANSLGTEVTDHRGKLQDGDAG